MENSISHVCKDSQTDEVWFLCWTMHISYNETLIFHPSIFRLPDGSLMEIKKVYPLDAVFDNPEDVPEDVRRLSV